MSFFRFHDMDKANGEWIASVAKESAFSNRDWQQNVCVWGVGAACDGRCQVCYARERMEVHKFVGVLKPR